ncbi:hypothetical protein [Sphingobacterium corticibacterium]|uniref:Uncharacterized protein n=1 Tax=Sphingobacterium corticibacterium TaxID=2484746 RepID=A0A4Q6XP70_9SPHI|nr:hypothetical protein [Sphingobacterium corticibacterium]RZF61465.1 hypothetical protein EWE74_01075 [Sphingobacterium corticibacterium]
MTESEIKPSKPIIAFFQEVVRGDIRKFNLKSNDSPTGGGARDLRISPVSDYWDHLLLFFPNRISDREYTGKIRSENNVKTITLMGPTTSRRNECRICKIAQIDNWNIAQEYYESIINSGNKWIYLLILDENKNVWASKFSTDKLYQMHDAVSAKITPLLSDNRTIRGFVHFN